MEEYTCPQCDRVFESRRGRGVHHWQMHGEKLPNCECARCGDIFYAEYKRVYCSTDCRNAAVSYAGTANPNYRQGMSTGTCDLCGNEFEYYPSEKKGRYCPS